LRCPLRFWTGCARKRGGGGWNCFGEAPVEISIGVEEDRGRPGPPVIGIEPRGPRMAQRAILLVNTKPALMTRKRGARGKTVHSKRRNNEEKSGGSCPRKENEGARLYSNLSLSARWSKDMTPCTERASTNRRTVFKKQVDCTQQQKTKVVSGPFVSPVTAFCQKRGGRIRISGSANRGVCSSLRPPHSRP